MFRIITIAKELCMASYVDSNLSKGEGYREGTCLMVIIPYHYYCFAVLSFIAFGGFMASAAAKEGELTK
jgi:hypothetical protein